MVSKNVTRIFNWPLIVAVFVEVVIGIVTGSLYVNIIAGIAIYLDFGFLLNGSP